MANTETLLQRLLNAPDLAKIVPQMPPEQLHRVITTCGLEDCAEVLALVTPEQLTRILDVDVWRAGAPGTDEQFDTDRFGLWIAVLMEAGPTVAAEKVMGLDLALVTSGLLQHAAAYDLASVEPYLTLDGDEMPARALTRGPVCRVAGFVLEARRTSSSWDAIVALLEFMSAEHPAYFHRLMRGWIELSDDAREDDGCDSLLDDEKQDMLDLTIEREARREAQGFVSPAQAHAFLKGGRQLRLDADRPAPSPIALAYFRAIERAGVIEILHDAGVPRFEPRALLATAEQQASRLSWIEAHVASHPGCAGELAYLANAIVAGCAIQGRAFTVQEAGDAATATCNLGLENWPPHWSDPDLVTAFQVGCAVLHRDVGMYVAQHLVDVLAGIQCSDDGIQLGLDELRHELIAGIGDGEPWRARDALDVLLTLDAPSWAALLALIDECPAVHAALDAARRRGRTIEAADFAFIAQNSQIALVREFMAALPSALAG